MKVVVMVQISTGDVDSFSQKIYPRQMHLAMTG